VPPRKKQATEAGEPLAPGRKKKAPPAKAAEDAAPVTKKRRAPSTGGSGNGGGGFDLVIVESPAKAKTINKYLGSGFKVLASYGHVRDLPKRRRKGELVAGIDIDGGWVPTYVVQEKEGGKGRRSPREILAELKREADRADRIFLATDPDREGEAIAWHLEDELRLDDARTFRIAFNEITRAAVNQAIAHPGKIDMERVHAQEARRILDRVVGYPLSGLLSKKVARRSSAGRVQSVALRLVVDREREIEAFKPEENWTITALLAPLGSGLEVHRPFTIVRTAAPPTAAADRNGQAKEEEKEHEGKEESAVKKEVPEGAFEADLAEWAGVKFALPNDLVRTEQSAQTIARALDRAHYQVSKVEQKDRPERAQPPFTTSTLQQQASIRLRFTAQRTMQTAQKLYEGVDLGQEGSVALITYMRTDSTRVSNEALQAVRNYIDGHYGQAYLPAKANTYASGKSAQEAHEAIRPTDLAYTPERVSRLGLSGDQLRLYTLIYQRFVASQMTPAVFAVTNVEVTATPRQGDAEAGAFGLFKAQGRILKFDGYRRVLAPGRQEDATLPPLSEKQDLDRLDLTASQRFTKPLPRYNEASLIKALEKEGIGRPSTYATILSKITSEERGYIEVRERKFYATEIGKVVTDLLVAHFPRVMDLKFTSHMEEELDQIETRQTEYHEVLTEFWTPFSQALAEAEEKMPSKRGVETGEMCPRCGRPLILNYSKKTGREFVGCSVFRDGCKYIKPREGEPERDNPPE
jgi:DNA topoisomerase-1